MKFSFKNPRAETLLEVVISVAMIMVVLAPASALFISSSQNTSGNRNDLVASMMAQEGLEIIRNIRDTNFLRFPEGSVSDCWNMKPDAADCAIPANKISAGSYTVSPDLQNPAAVHFAPVNDAMALENPSADYRLKLDESSLPVCDLVTTTNCHTHFKEDTHLYIHSADATRGTPVDFYRDVKIEYLDLNSDSASDLMRVTSTVVYRAGSKWKNIIVSTSLSRIP